jgi:hypothetical protein
MPIYPDRVFLQWSMTNSSEPFSYDFYVYKNRTGVDSNWEQLNVVPLRNTYNITIPETILAKDNSLFFKIKLMLDNKNYESNIVGFGSDLNKKDFLVVKEIIRKVQLMRKILNGIQCKILKKKNYGTPCNKCIDIATKKVTHSHCPTCYGTRITNGFYDPIETYCKIHEVSPKAQKESVLGTVDNVIASCGVCYPVVSRGDIVIESVSNRRWIVNETKRLFYKTVLFDQQVEIRQLSAKDVEHNVNR